MFFPDFKQGTFIEIVIKVEKSMTKMKLTFLFKRLSEVDPRLSIYSQQNNIGATFALMFFFLNENYLSDFYLVRIFEVMG